MPPKAATTREGKKEPTPEFSTKLPPQALKQLKAEYSIPLEPLLEKLTEREKSLVHPLLAFISSEFHTMHKEILQVLNVSFLKQYNDLVESHRITTSMLLGMTSLIRYRIADLAQIKNPKHFDYTLSCDAPSICPATLYSESLIGVLSEISVPKKEHRGTLQTERKVFASFNGSVRPPPEAYKHFVYCGVNANLLDAIHPSNDMEENTPRVVICCAHHQYQVQNSPKHSIVSQLKLPFVSLGEKKVTMMYVNFIHTYD